MRKFFAAVLARSHGQYFCVDGLRAGDVERRVANHQNLFAAQLFSQQPAAALARDGGYLIPVLVVVAKPAGGEMVPKMVMTQLDLRAEPDVAREQADDRRPPQVPQIPQRLAHAGQDLACKLAEEMIEPEDVAVEKPLKILRPGLDVMAREKLADDRRIGAAGKA